MSKMKLRPWRLFSPMVQVAAPLVSKLMDQGLAAATPAHVLDMPVNVSKTFTPLLIALHYNIPNIWLCRVILSWRRWHFVKVSFNADTAFPIQLLNRHITLIITDLSSHYWHYSVDEVNLLDISRFSLRLMLKWVSVVVLKGHKLGPS